MRWVLIGGMGAVGAVVGVILTLAAGTVCVDGVDESFCGLNLLTWDLSSGVAIGLASALGGLVGGMLGFLASLVFSRRGHAASV